MVALAFAVLARLMGSVTDGGAVAGIVVAFCLMIAAGIAGMALDSVLGATLENSGRMGNDSVNFVSNVFAADLALIVALAMA